MDKAELLKVLDMSEDEQWTWICKNYFVWSQWDHNWYYGKQIICCIADFAFRLRDESELNRRIMYLVQNPETDESELAKEWWRDLDYDTEIELYNWWINCAKPIHWIIAALIAKGIDNG